MVLIGYRGSGKSTVGKLLSRRLGRPFADSDDWIVRRAGKTIRELFADGGEAAFRDLEKEVVREIALLSDHVIALGGGALGSAENLAAILDAKHPIVYLRCEPKELLRRIQCDPATAANRPALSRLGGGIEEIENILGQREPLWQRVMTWQVDVTALSPEDAADAIARRI